MSPQYEAFSRAIAGMLDHIRNFTPMCFEINLVFIHKTDRSAHMVMGQSDPLEVRQALDDTIAAPGAYEMTGSAVDGFKRAVEDTRQ